MDFKMIIEFLIDLELNNNRYWFMENKSRYDAARATFEQFLTVLLPMLQEMDPSLEDISVKKSIFRIYRDVRFSKNKAPYKNNFGAFISRGGRKSPYAGYYIHLQPDKSFIGGGIYKPDSIVLKALRNEIFENTDEFKKIISEKSFLQYFHKINGEKLKLAPKGFPKDFIDIELLKYKSYTVTHSLENDFLLQPDVYKAIIPIFKKQKKFNYFLNRAVDRVYSNS